jgi:hypothetical protein
MDGNTDGVDKAIANHKLMIGFCENGLNKLRDCSKRATLLKTPVTIGKPGNLACFQCIHWLGLCCDTTRKILGIVFVPVILFSVQLLLLMANCVKSAATCDRIC